MTVPSTWDDRELPVLADLVVRADLAAGKPGGLMAASLDEVAQSTQLDITDVRRAVRALGDAGYIRTEGMGRHISGVSEDARRAVGQWPAEGADYDAAVAQMIAKLEADEAAEPDPERKSRLRKLREWLGETAKDVSSKFAAELLVTVARVHSGL